MYNSINKYLPQFAQALSAGPNIIRCFEFLEEPESLTCILVFEWVNIVSPQVLTTLQLRQDFLLQLLKAVQYCHQDAPRKVVHRDIKPGNILLQQTAAGKIEAKLADWGLAVFVDQIESYFGPAGTPGYKCPHLHVGCLLGVRSVRDGFPLDMWSVGCVALEVLSGSKNALFKPTSQQHERMRAAQQTLNGNVDSLGPSAFRTSVDAYAMVNYTKILGMRDFFAMFHPKLFTYLCSEVATVLEAVGNCAAFMQLVPGPKAKDKMSLHVLKKISVAEPMAQQCCESLYAALHKAKEYDLVSYTHKNSASAARKTHDAGILRFRSAQTAAAVHILLGLQGSELVAVAESFFLILRRELLCHHWRAAKLQYVHANTAGVCEVARMRLNKQLIFAKRDGVRDTKGHTQLQLPLKRVADTITPDIKAIFTRGGSDSQSNAESGVKKKGDVETRHNRHVVADVTALLMKLRVKQYEMKLRDCTRDATDAIDRVHNPSVEDRVAAPLAASANELEPARARWRGTGSATKRNSRHALPAIFQLKQQCNLAAKHFSQHKSKRKNAKRGRYSRGRKKLSTVSRRDASSFSTRHARSSAPTSIPVMNEVDDLDSDGCDSARASDSHVVAVDVHGDLAYLAGPSEPEKGGVIGSVLAWFGGGRDGSGGGGGSDLLVRKVGGYFDQLIFKWNRAMDTFNRLRDCLDEVTMGEAEREGDAAAAADSKMDTRLGSKVDTNADAWPDDGMHVPPTLPANNVYVVKARR